MNNTITEMKSALDRISYRLDVQRVESAIWKAQVAYNMKSEQQGKVFFKMRVI